MGSAPRLGDEDPPASGQRALASRPPTAGKGALSPAAMLDGKEAREVPWPEPRGHFLGGLAPGPPVTLGQGGPASGLAGAGRALSLGGRVSGGQ